MTPAYFITWSFGCFAGGLALGGLLWFNSKPVEPSITGKHIREALAGYQPVMPPGVNVKNINPPTGIRDAAWSPGSLPTSDHSNPAPNPFVEHRKDQVVK